MPGPSQSLHVHKQLVFIRDALFALHALFVYWYKIYKTQYGPQIRLEEQTANKVELGEDVEVVLKRLSDIQLAVEHDQSAFSKDGLGASQFSHLSNALKFLVSDIRAFESWVASERSGS
jgi:hypothetical protein